MKVQFLDDLEDVGAKAWEELLLKSPTRSMFQSWAWQKAWWQAFKGPGRCLYLVALYDGGHVRVLLPLMREGRVLRFTGHGMAPCSDLLYEPAYAGMCPALWQALKERHDWDMMELDHIPDASPSWRQMKAGMEACGLFPVAMQKASLWGIILEGREQKIAQTLHTGVLAKHAGIFASRGKVRVSHDQVASPEHLPWGEFFSQHIHRWAIGLKPSPFARRPARDLYRALVQNPGPQSSALMTTIWLDNRPAAFHLGFVLDGIFYVQVLTFDPVLRRFSPDDVLWRALMAYALEHKCRQVVLTAAEEPVVRRFAECTGTARMIRVFRTRSAQWGAKIARWTGKVPLASMVCVFAGECWQVLNILCHRKKIVKTRRHEAEGAATFAALRDSAVPALIGPVPIPRPEVELLRRLRPELKDTRVLDMGAGDGRRGIYFAPVVSSYVALAGTDHMAARIRGELDDVLVSGDVVTADPRQMSFAPDGGFDLVLFGADRIDEVSDEDRRRIFREVKRVGREGALFFFSSRNLQGLTLRRAYGALDLLRRLQRRLLMAAANRNLQGLRHQLSAALFDETGSYRLPAHYIAPREQVRVLKELGFHDIRIFSIRTGLEVRDWRRWDKLNDPSLYYLCRV